jgi:hypothetical protein
MLPLSPVGSWEQVSAWKRESPATAAGLSPSQLSQLPIPQDTSVEKPAALAPELTPENPSTAISDTDLSRVVEAWGRLPEHIKAAVLALIETARGWH